MHDTPTLVLMRIERFVRERLEPALIRDRMPLELAVWEVPGEPVPFADAVSQRFTPLDVGGPWGRPWGTTWLHVRGSIPGEWIVAGTELELEVDLGFHTGQSGFQAEALVWRADGTVVKAIEPANRHVRLEPGPVDLYLEAASNPDLGSNWTFAPTPLGDPATAGTEPIYTLRSVDAVLRDVAVWELSQDVRTLLGLIGEIPEGGVRRAEILHALERMVDIVDPDDVAGTAAAARSELAGVLAAPAAASAHRITAVGHAHIDSAWLWPTRETVRKCARTFSNVLDLMERHPGFVFAASSAQQYAWVKRFYPQLFDRIRARVAEGRFVPVGGMWVESDTNMPGAEAMARQFVTGQAFFKREFGRTAVTGWLPDSFGYSGAMPQLLALSGMRDFLTQKISWNEVDRFPHDTFWWEGIDGTRVFTHFPPVDAYNSDLGGADLARAERQYAEKGKANSSLVPFGHGDGGGGPTREMLAAAERAASLEGSPTVTIATPEAFFAQAREEYPDPPVWTGELYLEFHRGTYTSQARTKRGNRRSEHLLREAELWAVTAAVRTGAPYPYAELESAWHTVLLAQFHDILPGSSIAWVAQEAERAYAGVAETLEHIIGDALTALAFGDAADDRVVFNASPFPIDGVPALGAGVPATFAPASATNRGEVVELDNGRVHVEVDASGRISSLVDMQSGREVVAPGEFAAELQIFRDTPTQWDAWDVDRHYRRHETRLDEVDALEAAEESGVAVVRTRRHVGDSTIEQEFRLRPEARSVEIVTRVDWRERQKLLKLAFPIDVHADRAASEVQFGHVHRPTHENTSWDAARFETSAQRWVHVGEPAFGVAIANDASYGHDVLRQHRRGGGSTTLVRQSLLRAALFPDPGADQGVHEFRTEVSVGAGIPEAVESGYRTNLPLRTPAAPAAPVLPLIRVSEAAIVVEAVKLAEDRSGDLVVRLYESTGNRASGVVTVDADVASVVETDLLEAAMEGTAVVRVTLAGVELSLRPFQIVTLRFARTQPLPHPAHS